MNPRQRTLVYSSHRPTTHTTRLLIINEPTEHQVSAIHHIDNSEVARLTNRARLDKKRESSLHALRFPTVTAVGVGEATRLSARRRNECDHDQTETQRNVSICQHLQMDRQLQLTDAQSSPTKPRKSNRYPDQLPNPVVTPRQKQDNTLIVVSSHPCLTCVAAAFSLKQGCRRRTAIPEMLWMRRLCLKCCCWIRQIERNRKVDERILQRGM